MALILNLETTTTNCSVGLAKDGQNLSVLEDRSGEYSHAEKLHGFIEQALEENDLILNDLDAIAVSSGPGSYTGLRIGVSAAKGLCFSQDIPLVAISTASVYYQQVAESKKPVVVVMNSRKNEIYAADYDAEGHCIKPIYTTSLSAGAYSEELKSLSIFIGNGVAKLCNILGNPKDTDGQFMETLPSAKEMASLSEAKFKAGKTENLAYFEPDYLKPVWAKKINS